MLAATGDMQAATLAMASQRLYGAGVKHRFASCTDLEMVGTMWQIVAAATSENLTHFRQSPLINDQSPCQITTMQSELLLIMTILQTDVTGTLQVDDDAPLDVIKSQYRNLAKVCHPDVHDEGHEMCILLNEVCWAG